MSGLESAIETELLLDWRARREQWAARQFERDDRLEHLLAERQRLGYEAFIAQNGPETVFELAEYVARRDAANRVSGA